MADKIVMAEPTPGQTFSSYAVARILALVICSAACLFMLGTTIWGMNRGFDLLDEGFALLSAQNPSACPFHSSFSYFLALCPNVLGIPVLSLRFWHLSSRLCAPIVLAFGFLKWFEKNADHDLVPAGLDKAVVVVVTIIGSLVGYAMLVPQTLSYGSLSSFLLLCASGFFFWGQSVKSAQPSFKAAFCLTGFLTALAFFVKFSAALSSLCVFAIGIAAIRKDVRSTCVWLGLGLCLGLLFFFLLLQNPIAWYTTFVGELGADFASSHGPTHVFGESAKSLFKHLCEISAAGAAFLIIFTLAKQLSVKSVSKYFPATILSLTIVVTAVFAWSHYRTTEIVHRSVLYFSLLPVLCFCAVQLRSAGSTIRSASLWAMLLLLFLPVILALGTDAPLLLGALCSAAPLYLLVVIAYFVIGKKYNNMLFFYLGQALFCVLSVAVFCGGYLICPHDTEMLTLQTERFSDGSPLAGLMVEPRIKKYIENTKQILEKNGYHEGDYILGLYDVPGLIYAIRGRSPGAGWYLGEPICAAENKHHLSTIHLTGTERVFLIVTTPENKPLPSETVMEQLRSKGMTDYELVGRTLHPYVYHSIYCKSFIYAPSRLVQKH